MKVTYLHAKKHIIWMRTKQEQRIPAFYIDRRSPVTILFSHGNAEDLGMIYEWFCEFSKELQVAHNFLFSYTLVLYLSNLYHNSY